MKRFLLYGYGGSYNHGAEAIIKTTIQLIREKYSNAYIAVSSHFPEQDREYNIDANVFFSPIQEAWDAEKRAASQSEKEQLAREMYHDALNFITPDTVCLSVGGDNFCYPNWHRQAVFQCSAAKNSAPSILWGCSVEPAAITSEMTEVLGSYTHILARESLTYIALRDKCIDTDVQLLPDPAFRLNFEPIELPPNFQSGDIVGINISPLVIRRESVPGIINDNFVCLINHILTHTSMKVALIPHVVMPADNDNAALSELFQLLPEQLRSRVWLVDEKLSASQLKYVISKCRFLVCSRTHASIAAYSSGVPTLVIGYSVKSTGIAEDLGVSEFVIDIENIKLPHSVKDAFTKLFSQEDKVRSILVDKTEDYLKQSKKYLEYI